MSVGATTMENSVEIPQKTKVALPCDPANPLLGIYLGKTIIHKGTCTSMFIAALFTKAEVWKQLNVHQQMNG